MKLTCGLFALVCLCVGLSDWMSVCLCLSVSLSDSVYLLVCLTDYRSIGLFFCWSVCLSSNCLKVCLTDCRSFCWSVCPLVCLTDCLSVCRSLSDWLPVYWSVFRLVCLSVWRSVWLTVYLCNFHLILHRTRMAEMSFVMKAISTLLSSLKRAVKENPTVGKCLPPLVHFC